MPFYWLLKVDDEENTGQLQPPQNEVVSFPDGLPDLVHVPHARIQPYLPQVRQAVLPEARGGHRRGRQEGDGATGQVDGHGAGKE